MKEDNRVKIIVNCEYPNTDFVGSQGEVLATIPPNSSDPHRIMVKLENGPISNFLTGEVRILTDD